MAAKRTVLVVLISVFITFSECDGKKIFFSKTSPIPDTKGTPAQFSALESKLHNLEKRVEELEKQLHQLKNDKEELEVKNQDGWNDSHASHSKMRGPMGPPTAEAGKKCCRRGPKGEKGAKGEPGRALEPPTITTRGMTVWTSENKSVSLLCTAKGYPLPDLHWFGKGNFTRHLSKNATTITSQAMFHDVSLEDIGIYVCQAKSILGEKEIKFTLQVKVKPRASVDSKLAIGRLGASVEFPVCNVFAIPSAVISWYRAYGVLPPGRHFYKKEKHIFGIKDAKLEDSGYYFCEAKNYLGVAKVAVQLLIGSKEFVMDIIPPNSVALVTQINLTCGATGYPTPNLKWFKNKELKTDCKISHPEPDKTRATIYVTEPGIYTCEADSGGVAKHVNTTVKDVDFQSRILRKHNDLKAQLLTWVMEKNMFSTKWVRCYANFFTRFNNETFRSDCKHKNYTVILLEGEGNIFGGFSDVDWKPSYYDMYKGSNASFLFALKRVQKYSPMPVKFDVRPEMSNKAIRVTRYSGPIFGSGPDLKVYRDDRSNGLVSVESKLGVAYQGPKPGKCCFQNWFAGNTSYNPINHIEVLYPIDE